LCEPRLAEEDDLVAVHRGVGVAIVEIGIGRYKPARGLQAVLTIVAKLADILAQTVLMAQMGEMEPMGKMAALVV
jgi:hypothetical protein